MSENKILTVSVAAYNVEKYLGTAIDSLTGCKKADGMEILIINDGSNDGTEKIAAAYEEKFPGLLRLVNKENGGWGSTVNTGIRLARGKYFRQLDADDFYRSENLEEYIRFLKKEEADLVISPFVVFDDRTGQIRKRIGYEFGKSSGRLSDML